MALPWPPIYLAILMPILLIDFFVLLLELLGRIGALGSLDEPYSEPLRIPKMPSSVATLLLEDMSVPYRYHQC